MPVKVEGLKGTSMGTPSTGHRPSYTSYNLGSRSSCGFIRRIGPRDCESYPYSCEGPLLPQDSGEVIFLLLRATAAGGLSNGVGERKTEVDKVIINRCQLLIA